MSALVSVILPVYNRAASLGYSMRSVLEQSYRDLELLVVDDASTENLQAIVEGFRDSRVKYLRLERNGGVSRARNAGLAASQGQFIAFQDSDDMWLPGRLKMQLDLLKELPEEVGVVVHSKVLYGVGANGDLGVDLVSIQPPPKRILRPDEDQIRKFLMENRISLQNALFRRSCYPSLCWFDDVTRANADWAFSSSLAQHCRILEYPQPVVFAFSSTDGISKLKRTKAIGLIRIVKRNRDIYRKYPDAYGNMMWQIARILSRGGKHKLARPFYFEGLKNDPAFLLRALWEKLKMRARI